MKTRRPLSLAATLTLAAALGAQDAPKIQSDATTLILPAGRYELAPLIDQFAAFLHWNVLYSAAELQQGPGPLELQTKQQLTMDAAEDTLCDLLHSRGFLIQPRDPAKNLYEAISLNGPRARELSSGAPTRTVEQILARPNLKQMVTTTVALETINATIATNALRPFYAAVGGAKGVGLTFGTAGDASSMLLSGLQSDVAKAIEMLHKLDGKESEAPAKKTDRPAGAADGSASDLRAEIAEIQRAIKVLTERLDALEKRLANR